MRGKQLVTRRPFWRTVGSSPHAWETAEIRNPTPREYRFIPTCVGNSSLAFDNSEILSVHPHMRGKQIC